MVVCDLDGFKQINDRFGHMEGNKVLRLVSEALRSRCREYDYVARMGGDEFVLLLPGSDRKSIQGRIAEIRQIAIETGMPSRAAFRSASARPTIRKTAPMRRSCWPKRISACIRRNSSERSTRWRCISRSRWRLQLRLKACGAGNLAQPAFSRPEKEG